LVPPQEHGAAEEEDAAETPPPNAGDAALEKLHRVRQSSPPNPTSVTPQRSAIITGGACGSILLLVATTLKEPYKSIILYSSPTVSAAIASIWPLIFNWAVSSIHRKVMMNMLLNKRKSINERRKSIKQNLNKKDISSIHKIDLENLLLEYDNALIAIERKIIDLLTKL
jgi:hypothetical protein